MRLITVLSIFFAHAFGQTITVHGVVRDKSTGAPLPGARVGIAGPTGGEHSAYTSEGGATFTTSNAMGEYALACPRPDPARQPALHLFATADGYATPAIRWTPARSIPVVLRTGENDYTQDLFLVKLSTLAGVIVDDESRQPLSGIQVQLTVAEGFAGRLIYGNAGVAMTGSRGDFSFGGLLPGRYVLYAGDKERRFTLQAIASRAQADEIVNQRGGVTARYGPLYWQGALFRSDATFLLLNGGERIELGQMRIRKTPRRVLAGTADGASCEPGEKIMVALTDAWGAAYSGELGVPCGGYFSVSNVSANHELRLWSWKALGNKVAALSVQPFFDTASGLILVSPAPGVPVHGRVVLEGIEREPLPPALRKVRVWLRPDPRPPVVERHWSEVDATGWFPAVAYLGLGYAADVSGLPEGYCVKKVLMDDEETAPGNELRLRPGLAAHSLTIVVSARPAALQVTIPGREESWRNATIVAVREDLAVDKRPRRVLKLTPGAGGVATQGGLAPGYYLVAAVSAERVEDIEEPGGLDRILAGAKRVTVDEGRTVSVEVAAPAK